VEPRTHGVSGEVDAVVLAARTADRRVVAGGGKQLVDTGSADAVAARRLARLAQRRRAAHAAEARVDRALGVLVADEADGRRVDETVEVGIDRQARQLHDAPPAPTANSNTSSSTDRQDPTRPPTPTSRAARSSKPAAFKYHPQAYL